jgi:hypothetical protein
VRAVLFPSTLLLACSSADPGPPIVWDHGPLYPCIEVRPRQLEFRTIDMLSEPEGTDTRSVTIGNLCTGDLEIRGLDIAGKDPGSFSLSTPPTVLVGSDEEVQLDVTFRPSAPGDAEARVVVGSNDPERREQAIRLAGRAEAPRVLLTPESLELGAPSIGCPTSHAVQITNTGNLDLSVEAVTLAMDKPGEFGLDLGEVADEPTPWTLAPYIDNVQGPFIDIFVDYRPLDSIGDEAQLVVTTNDPAEPRSVMVARGTGTRFGAWTDSFEQPRIQQTDVLFTLDRQGALLDLNEAVGSDIAEFTDRLSALDVDFRVAVVVGDAGCVLGEEPFIDNTFSASEATATFATMADADYALGPYGSNTAAHSALIEAALSTTNTRPGGCNEGLLREGAMLSLVHIVDGADESLNTWDYYVALFRSIQGEPDGLRTNTVGGDVPGGCGSAGPATGYYEATVETGGVFRSICDPDWDAHFEALAQASVPNPTAFPLSQLPVPPTIVVTIDGTPATRGWTYDETTNAVVFYDEKRPAPGVTLDISYQVMPDCER